MLEVIRYTAERAGEWNAFVAQSKNGTFLFDRRYMDYHADRFTDFSLMFYSEGRLAALLPAELKGCTLRSHGGLTYGGLITDSRMTASLCVEIFRLMNSRLREEGVRSVVYKAVPWIYHRYPAEEDLYAIFRTCTARLAARDISSTIVLQEPAGWHRDRRYAANKAGRNGISVSRSDDFAAFWTVLDNNLNAKYGVHPVHSLAEIQLLKDRFPDNIRLYTAVKDGTVLGGTVLYMTPQTVHSQYISASPEGKAQHAIDAIFDLVLHRECDGYRFFDFGKSTEDSGNILNEGLIHQKEGFGGRGVCYDTYTWDL